VDALAQQPRGRAPVARLNERGRLAIPRGGTELGIRVEGAVGSGPLACGALFRLVERERAGLPEDLAVGVGQPPAGGGRKQVGDGAGDDLGGGGWTVMLLLLTGGGLAQGLQVCTGSSRAPGSAMHGCQSAPE
jgi:hypothetical protein